MKISSASLDFLAGALVIGLLGPACIFTSSEDDGDVEDTDDDGTPPAETGLPSDSTGPVADDTSDGPDDGTTGDYPGECTDNLVLDPGFEAGGPSEEWTEESELFETLICDESCVTDEGGDAAAHSGDWWAWFGGVEDQSDNASVAQMITIDPDMAYLRFWFQIRSGADTGDDTFTVTLGGDTVFMVNDQDMSDYDEYQQIDLDVSPWADGGSYELRFASSTTGVGLTSFFLDEVSLVSCSEAAGTSTGFETEGQDETAGSTTDDTTGGSTSDTGSTTDGTTGGSTDGTTSGSSGSSSSG